MQNRGYLRAEDQSERAGQVRLSLRITEVRRVRKGRSSGIGASALRTAPPLSRGPPVGRGAWLRLGVSSWRMTSFCFFNRSVSPSLPLAFFLSFFFYLLFAPSALKGRLWLALPPPRAAQPWADKYYYPTRTAPRASPETPAIRACLLETRARSVWTAAAELLSKMESALDKMRLYPTSILKVTIRASATAGSKRRRNHDVYLTALRAKLRSKNVLFYLFLFIGAR